MPPDPPDDRASYHPLYGGRASIANRRRLLGLLFGTRVGRWVLLALVVVTVTWLALR